MEIDHLAVACGDLEEGSAWLEAALGVSLQPGGQHEHYKTHNRLLGLGPGLYLEVIAPDPTAGPPERPRWFELDQAGEPRLANWIARTDDLDAGPVGAGETVPLTRGDLSWEITVPPDGALCEGGAFPSMIRWGDGLHPSLRLKDVGVRLKTLAVHHPEPDRIAGLLKALSDPRVLFKKADAPRLSAVFETPHGERRLE